MIINFTFIIFGKFGMMQFVADGKFLFRAQKPLFSCLIRLKLIKMFIYNETNTKQKKTFNSRLKFSSFFQKKNSNLCNHRKNVIKILIITYIDNAKKIKNVKYFLLLFFFWKHFTFIIFAKTKIKSKYEQTINVRIT